jgi:hypothetical protein
MRIARHLPWTLVVPAVAMIALAATWGRKPGDLVLALVAALLAGAVLASVHHAEVVAHRVGEPLGSLVLAVAVTVIEVGLIVALMASLGDRHARAGHRVRGGHDHVQRRRRALPRRHDAAPPHRDLQRRRNGDRIRDRDHAGNTVPRPSDVHDERARRDVLLHAAHVCGRRVGHDVRAVRLRAERAPS